MTIHDNQLVLLTDAEIAEISAEVTHLDEMESVFRLGALRDQHKAEYDAGLRLQEQANDAKSEALALDKQLKAAQKAHDKLGGEIRLSEERAFQVVMNSPGIEEIKAIHGQYTGKVVRSYVINRLSQREDYQRKLEELGDLNDLLESLPEKIRQVIKRANSLEGDAQAQFKNAGSVLLEIRKLEDLLNE